ncbi:hypothetical protein A2962_05105 [Candidatus Woesebacteria bacterium RIFCSPLOWO2_01_FULL_39_61]|uniref:Glycosyltransferase RgtA/B/C/D-like domain-containing protein n=1 Tax=Candidatus Woesebacteria bacterium RIFCSPHIGHO2_02_FULL_39_13 TaxID=1802505 RepID=A0A1F7YZ66_9BACT|nr:MAG: hypothetical protein A2692_03355 [Candidatus Woesebacteria bacterium RIFCSPHIGHO2_01_FULL_39_95]OGM32646.1 MAG: hypothetical protein A3D01_05330 [Candidatus Woesebacteria bacterium RIFCSPHIGHO2_02_FULL_39_13]OGM66714.1 MAG: hypothetical protein A2962_05105 [Candidatus Woesebacteria bacterium RIFCSPLOWO2_01_FULL_39_61]OGM73785.1 MAG: hypothetical protein A3H19_02625 [Candidatus Woesebacteria bacterium RIFCSPLOWO2_12_FULL_39_9]
MDKIFRRTLFIPIKEYLILSFILYLSLIARFYKINNPIADWHSFRQADTASVTRFFLNEGVNPLVPIYHDVSTTQSGIFNPNGYRFVEFPIFNIFHLYFYKIIPSLGFDIVGRLTSIISSLVSTFLIFLICKKMFNNKIALMASALYAFLPYNIYFTRVTLPEPLATTFALSAIWFFILYLENNSLINLFISAISFSISLLIKPYVLFFGVPMFYLAYVKYSLKDLIKAKEFYFWLSIVLLPFIFWRIWMLKFPEGIPFWKWTFNGDGIRFRPSFWRWIFGERLTSMILGYWGLIPFVFGIISVKKKQLFSQMFLLGALIYVCIFATANVRHDYYQTIIVPTIVITTAVGLVEFWNLKNYSKLLTRVLVIFTLIIMIMTSFVQIKEFYKINRPEIVEAGQRADKLLPKDALVIAPYNGDTAFLYQTKRRGWPVVDRPIDDLIEKGAMYFVSVDLNHYQTLEFAKRFKIIESATSYIIIDLTAEK